MTAIKQKINRGGVRLSIIIVSYNTREITAECLRSIYGAKWKSEFEIIVVDNNSYDGSADLIKKEFPDVRLIENKDNKLFAIANNQGAEIATGEYLLLLNSDTLVYDDNIERMMDYFDSSKSDVICIGPKILNKDRSIQSFGAPASGYMEFLICQFKLHKFFPWLAKIWRTLPLSPNVSQERGWVSGCCMLIRHHLYTAVNGLNEQLVFYGEEPEFGYRTRKLGYRTLYYHAAEIVHLGGASTTASNTNTITNTPSDGMKRYAALVGLTTGYRHAINISRIKIFACAVKFVMSSKKDFFKNEIRKELHTISYFKNCLRNNQK